MKPYPHCGYQLSLSGAEKMIFITALRDMLSPVLSQVIISCRDKQCPSTYLDNSIAILKEFLAPHLEEFRQWGCGASPTFKYWDMFLRAVEIMLQNV